MSRDQNPNLDLLRLAVIQLGELADEMVFLGGCVTGLLITDPAAPPIRNTIDVDAIVQVSSHLEYRKLSDQLQEQGFKNDTSKDAPICRWRANNIILDVLPTDPKILGFGNVWYEEAMKNAVRLPINLGLSIKLVSAPFFLITKMEAFDGRGNDDIMTSHDIEDIIAVLDGRHEIINEVSLAGIELKMELKKRFSMLLKNPNLVYAVSGHLPPDSSSQGRVDLVLQKIEYIGNMK